MILGKRMASPFIESFRKSLKLNRLRRVWKSQHWDSGMLPMNIFDGDLVTVGKASYGELNVVSFNRKARLYIGNYCSIAQQVHFILDAEHNTRTISTYPFRVKTLGLVRAEAFSKGDIVVDDDVWIGYGSTILSGVRIGQGAVVAAGSVVTGNVPPYAIAGGVPARVIRYRFPDEIRAKLLKTDFSHLTEDLIRAHIGELCEEVGMDTDLSWLPQKQEVKQGDGSCSTH